MSNTLTSNPIVITSPMAASLKNSGAWSSTMPVEVDYVYFFNPAATGDSFTVVDETGSNVVAIGRCESPNQSQVFSPLKRKNADIQVTQLGSGTLYIHLR